LNVAHHLAVYGGGIKGVDIARQHEFTRLAAALQRDNRDRRDRPLLGPLFEFLVVVVTPGNSAIDYSSGRYRQQ
jgi:hypothetical protein